jgi:hypothetical protein
MFAIVTILLASLVGTAVILRSLVGHLYVVPVGELHVVRLFGARTIVRRPGLHLHLGRFEDRRSFDGLPFVVQSPITTTSLDGAQLRVAAQFELVVVDPVRYERVEPTFKIRGRAVSDVVLAAEIGRRTLAELQTSLAAVEEAVRVGAGAALREFGVHVRDTFITVTDGSLARTA